MVLNRKRNTSLLARLNLPWSALLITRLGTAMLSNALLKPCCTWSGKTLSQAVATGFRTYRSTTSWLKLNIFSLYGSQGSYSSTCSFSSDTVPSICRAAPSSVDCGSAAMTHDRMETQARPHHKPQIETLEPVV